MKIFHTADVHLGLKFGSYPEELAKKLSEARYETLARMVASANEERCDLFVVGGDLFDNLKVVTKDVQRAAKILGQFDGVVAVLPGNHDFVTSQDDDIWKVFQAAGQDRVKVLTECQAYSFRSFDLDLTIYAAPCRNKHSKTHALGWLANAPRGESRFHIGLAHGSFEGLTPDTEGEYYPMTREDLLPLGLDLWMMGHIHVQFPLRPGGADRIFYPATPEPDGFDCRHEGKAWILELGEDKRINARSVSTGNFRFHHETLTLQSLQDLAALDVKIPPARRPKMLLKLKLSGSLPREEQVQVGAVLAKLKEDFLYFLPDHTELALQLAPDDIDREFVRETFPHRLLSALCAPGDREALQAAYDLLKETR